MTECGVWDENATYCENSVRFCGNGLEKGASRWKVWSCWSMKLSVWISQRGKRRLSERTVSWRMGFGIIVLLFS